MNNIQKIFGANGILSSILPGFSPRAIQQNMAEAVGKALDEEQSLIVEAGTGTGKTFAYLVPALLSGKKIIISTGTKNLQEQLFYRDLPFIRKALGLPRKIVLLKGRANYLCLSRLQMHLEDARFSSKELVNELQLIKKWSGRTQSGDIGELTDIAEDSLIWSYVTSTKENCLRQECPQFSDCHLMKARRKALEADILVVNHHLFFADSALRESASAELLPGSHAIIFDEAHQLAEVATNFMGEVLSSRQIIELAKDVIVEQINSAADLSLLREVALQLDMAVHEFRLTFGTQNHKNIWANICHKPALQSALNNLKDKLSQLQDMLKVAAERTKNFKNYWERCIELLNQFIKLTGNAVQDHIHWYETTQKTFRIHLTPISIANEFRKIIDKQKRAWIFTSATLSVDRHFEHFANALGLNDAQTLILDSPFNYEKQALLYIPPKLPEPSAQDYLMLVIEQAVPVLMASQGRAFFLFTSHRALQGAVELLSSRLDYPLLVQGSMPKSMLLQKFCQTANAILLGTSSFWEGVDVRGDALSCVIIDKLPFAMPDDPVLKARVAHFKEQGVDPFISYQLPLAVIALKQGAGRLIRDVNDRGVLMICDPRLLSKGYGKIFLKSLPSMVKTQELADVQSFFDSPKC